METQARYLLVGVFTLVCLLTGLGFTLWLAKVQLNRTFTHYDIVFDSVAGLGQASPVQYNGVAVGTVLAIALDRADPAKVRVRIEIYASTPVRNDTVATLASQGVTGVSYVALEGGSAASEPLRPAPGADVAEIASKPSVIQGLMTDAPDLLAEAMLLIEDIRGLTTPENVAALGTILQNTAAATARLDALATRAEGVMTAAEATLARTDSALAGAEAVLGTADATLGEARVAVAGVNRVITGDLPAILRDLRSASATISTAAGAVEGFTRSALPQVATLSGEARNLIAAASRVIADFGALSRRIGSDPGRFLLGTQTPAYRRSE